MIKLNDYLANFLIPEKVEATKLSYKDFIDTLEDGTPLQWKLEFKKEGFNLSSAMLTKLLDVCVHLEEAKLHKPLAKKIACNKKDHDKDGKGKHHGKSESCQKMS
jgi:hypothetical protein